MEDLYHAIIKLLFKDEDIPAALERVGEYLKKEGLELTYYIRINANQKIISNRENLAAYIRRMEERHENGKRKIFEEDAAVLEHKLEAADMVLRIEKCGHDKMFEIEEILDLFCRMTEKMLEIEVFRVNSFISPFFYEISKIFYTYKNHDEALDEFYYLVYGILGLKIMRLEKNQRIFFRREDMDLTNAVRVVDGNLVLYYAIERVLDKSIEIEKIMRVITFILNNFIDGKILEEKQKELMEYQISSKEHLFKLNRLLEKSLYKMTFISNIYKKLSRTKSIKGAMEIVNEFIKAEIGYEYLRIDCGIEELASGEKTNALRTSAFEDYLMDGKILYKLEIGKSSLSHEDDVYMGLIFNNSKIEIENILLYKKLEELATLDGITGLYIHRYFMDSLEKEILESKRYGKELSVIMMDIDNFKKFNDTYGHLEGDYVLSEVAKIIRDSIRNVDIPCRYGGEEFVIILPFTGVEQSAVVAERIRENVEKHSKVTVSVGVTEYITGEKEDVLIKRADAAMYEAKKSGKNKVIRM